MAGEPQTHDLEQSLRHNVLEVEAILWDPASDALQDCSLSGCIGRIKLATKSSWLS
jgi:hypothetical protein